MLTSILAADSLSDDRDDGIGGTFTGGGFANLSDEFLLCNDCREGVFDNLSSVSLFFFWIIALSGLLLFFVCDCGRVSGKGLISGNALGSESSALEEGEGGLDTAGVGRETD